MRSHFVTVILSTLTATACDGNTGRDLGLAELRRQDLSATITTVGGYSPSSPPSISVEFPLPGSDPEGHSESDCAHLSQDVSVLIQGTPADAYRGGRAVNTWYGCDASGSAGATVTTSAVEVSFVDGGDQAMMQVQFGLPTLESPENGLVIPGAEVVVRMPTLPAVSASAQYSARLYAPGDGPVYDTESSRPNGMPTPIDLAVTHDGDLLKIRMPSDASGTWMLHISHPDHAAWYEIPVTRCDFKNCIAGMWDFYASFPGLKIEFVE